MSAELITLANGVRVIADPMTEIRSAAIGIWFNAGCVDEAADANGLAHLLEHMAFKGTKKRTAKQIAEEMEAVGGHLNASTGYQRTGYYARILEGDLETAFDILADILTEPTFLDEELVKEKEVVIQEIGEAADTPDDAVFDQLQAASFGDHPMARPILGTRDSVRYQTGETLRGFMTTHYQPANTIVAASGKIDPAKVVALTERYFGKAATSETPRRTSPAAFTGSVKHQQRDIEQTHVALAFPGVPSGSDDLYAMRIFSEALGGGMASRVFQEVREERGLAYSAYTFSEQYDETGLLCAYVGTEADRAAEAAKIAQDQIVAMADKTTDQEVDRARAMLKASLFMGLENPSGRMDAGVTQAFSQSRLVPVEELERRLDEVTPQDVQRCAALALSEKAAVSVIGPGDGEAIATALA